MTAPDPTLHRVHSVDAASFLAGLEDETIDCVVTSPPYPMVAMWDEQFARRDSVTACALNSGDGVTAYDGMHRQLSEVFQQVYRLLRPGGLAAVNIGDATRSMGGRFRRYANHSRLTTDCEAIGFDSLPMVLWRKSTNAPTKFMGSGMLPGGAYVTLEHEFILVLRKPGQRSYPEGIRQRSAVFWEERNQWYSDLWTFPGAAQQTGPSGLERRRSGAFPLELPFRLIHMFSVQGDTILDPFLGTGTIALAALAAGRNSLGLDEDARVVQTVSRRLFAELPALAQRAGDRLQQHRDFVVRRSAQGMDPPRYCNTILDTPVVTRQERYLQVPEVHAVNAAGEGRFRGEYRWLAMPRE